MPRELAVEVAPWKHDAQFVYSVTYDEGTLDALVNSYPIHEEHGIPGHICQVTGFLGKQRLDRGTSLFDVFYLNEDQIRFLVDRGWTFSSHSHSHVPTGQKGIDLDMEVRLSKHELERATGRSVDIITYWGNTALKDQIVPIAKEAGYLGVLSIDYPLNSPDFDVWDIGRGTIGRDLDGWVDNPSTAQYRHTKDAFPGHLTRENSRGKWLVDLTHVIADRLPPRVPESAWNRCCTPEILDSRLREVRQLWGDELWATVPEDVVHYTLLRRSAEVGVESLGPDRAACTVRLDELPDAVSRRELTFRAFTKWQGMRINGGTVDVRSVNGAFVWTAPVVDGTEFILEAV